MVQPENIFEHQRPSYWDGHFVGVCPDVSQGSPYAEGTLAGKRYAEIALRQFFDGHNSGLELRTFGKGQEFNPVDFIAGTIVQMQTETLVGRGPAMKNYARYGGDYDTLMPFAYLRMPHETMACYTNFIESTLVYRLTSSFGVVVPPARRPKNGTNTLYTINGDISSLQHEHLSFADSMQNVPGSEQIGSTQHFQTHPDTELLRRVNRLGVLYVPSTGGKPKRVFNFGIAPRPVTGTGNGA